MADNKILLIGGAVFLAFVVFGFTALMLSGSMPGGGGPEPTPAPTSTPTPIPIKVVGEGDLVYVDYILSLDDGSVNDTSIKSVAEDNGIYSPYREYEPLYFTIGAGQAIPGFENALIGMGVGEEKNFTVSPEEGYGQHEMDKLTMLPRLYAVPRMEEVDLLEFTEVYPEFELGEDIQMGEWNATVTAVTDSTVVLEHNPSEGTVIETAKWNETIVNVTGSEIYLRRDPVVGETYYDFVNNTPQFLSVKDLTDEVILIDYNHPLAGKTLHFYVNMTGIDKP